MVINQNTFSRSKLLNKMYNHFDRQRMLKFICHYKRSPSKITFIYFRLFIFERGICATSVVRTSKSLGVLEKKVKIM